MSTKPSWISATPLGGEVVTVKATGAGEEMRKIVKIVKGNDSRLVAE